MKKLIMFVAFAAMLAGCVSGPKVDKAPVAELDLNRYLGEWYEIERDGRLMNLFEFQKETKVG